MGIDTADNELITLEVVHHYVEVLDRYFGNVCELDLIFNFHKVRAAAHSAWVICKASTTSNFCLQCLWTFLNVPASLIVCGPKEGAVTQTAESAHGGVTKPSVASTARSC